MHAHIELHVPDDHEMPEPAWLEQLGARLASMGAEDPVDMTGPELDLLGAATIRGMKQVRDEISDEPTLFDRPDVHAATALLMCRYGMRHSARHMSQHPAAGADHEQFVRLGSVLEQRLVAADPDGTVIGEHLKLRAILTDQQLELMLKASALVSQMLGSTEKMLVKIYTELSLNGIDIKDVTGITLEAQVAQTMVDVAMDVQKGLNTGHRLVPELARSGSIDIDTELASLTRTGAVAPDDDEKKD